MSDHGDGGGNVDALLKAHVAQLHYVRGRSKQGIAASLGMSRFKVARLLDEAIAEGIVRFEIQQPISVDSELSQALEATYGLDLAVVMPDRGDGDGPARAAARWLPDLVRDIDTLGVAWGATLQQVADALVPPQDHPKLRVVQICGAVAGLAPGTGPVETTQRFAERLGGRAYPLPAPALSSRRARDELARHPAIRPVVEMFDEVDLAVIGIGPMVAFPEAAGAVGYLLVHVYDETGGEIGTDMPETAIAMSVQQLERARLMAVASGESKKHAVLGALRTGLLNILFTDTACARYALAAH